MNAVNIHPLPTGAKSSGHRNFLFLCTSSCDSSCGLQCVHRHFRASAHGMAEDGYVYFAEAGRKQMEDDEHGVRYLPLDSNRLPSFGEVSAVVVLNDVKLVAIAHQTYPEAYAYLFQPSPQIEL